MAVSKWFEFPEEVQIRNLMLSAFIWKHSLSLSIRLFDMIVPLLLFYVLIHQRWVKHQLHSDANAVSGHGQNYSLVHYGKLLLKFLLFFFQGMGEGGSGGE